MYNLIKLRIVGDIIKKQISNEINISPHFGSYGKLVKIKKNANTKLYLKSLNVIRVFLFFILLMLVSFGAYLIITRYVIPMMNEDEKDLPVANMHNEEIKIDKETGFTVYDESLYMFTVSKGKPLSADYDVSLVDFQDTQVSHIIIEPLEYMVLKAKQDGIDLKFSVGYVSPEKQQELFDKKVDELFNSGETIIMARAHAKDYVSLPMESDNQTGLCVTLSVDIETYDTNDEYIWLINNAADYGFTFRYPDGKEKFTKIDSNPLVLRYVGEDNAIRMRQLALCLEEYLDYIG